ncbi:Hydroxyacylglutathione hydrolase [hydrothermal vent metagenome]|uniref:hydroxyacylglutathione hydrolase n=1 Tax=hydrothermal vent metagenome TaxID=652676 RepID=A0A3B0SFT7_9ZZZZ
MLEVIQIACLDDNYGFLVHDPDSKQTISIDSPDADAINAALQQQGWSLDAIWNTHHHFDHIGGNAALQKKWNCQIIAPAGDAKHIPGADQLVTDADVLILGAHRAKVLHTPGHTLGHVVYVFADDAIAFVGDTLFALGCGRLFEGGPEQMWPSLQKLMQLPANTKIYCAHEYTADNLRFALTIDPDNPALLQRGQQIHQTRANGQPTVPFLLETELATNPFLRAADPNIRQRLNLQTASDCEVFAEIRRQKDAF